MSKIAVFVLFLIVLVLIGPLISIWALNTLFGLGIAYTFWTWLAMAWIGLVINGNIGRKSS